MHFARGEATLSRFKLSGAPSHAARLHGWTWPLLIALADTFASVTRLYRRGLFSLVAREHGQGARQEKVRFLTQLFSTAT